VQQKKILASASVCPRIAKY